MGSWNATCNISQMAITPGTSVRVLFLSRCLYTMDPANALRLNSSGCNSKEGCYSTNFWFPRTVPLKAIYDDYGSVTDIDTISLEYELFWAQLEKDFISVEEGKYNITKKLIQNKDWEQLWQVVSEGRLRVNGYFGRDDQNMDEDEAGEKLDTGSALPVCAVFIREDVYQAMLKMPCLKNVYEPEDFENRNSKYVNKEVNIEFCKSKLANYIKKIEVVNTKGPKVKNFESICNVLTIENVFLAPMNPPFTLGISFYFEQIVNLIENGKIEKTDLKINDLLTQIAEIQYIGFLFSELRKTWHPGTGRGSQSDPMGQAFLYYKAMMEIALTEYKKDAEENAEWRDSQKNSLKKYYRKYLSK